MGVFSCYHPSLHYLSKVRFFQVVSGSGGLLLHPLRLSRYISFFARVCHVLSCEWRICQVLLIRHLSFCITFFWLMNECLFVILTYLVKYINEKRWPKAWKLDFFLEWRLAIPPIPNQTGMLPSILGRPQNRSRGRRRCRGCSQGFFDLNTDIKGGPNRILSRL